MRGLEELVDEYGQVEREATEGAVDAELHAYLRHVAEVVDALDVDHLLQLRVGLDEQRRRQLSAAHTIRRWLYDHEANIAGVHSRCGGHLDNEVVECVRARLVDKRERHAAQVLLVLAARLHQQRLVLGKSGVGVSARLEQEVAVLVGHLRDWRELWMRGRRMLVLLTSRSQIVAAQRRVEREERVKWRSGSSSGGRHSWQLGLRE